MDIKITKYKTLKFLKLIGLVGIIILFLLLYRAICLKGKVNSANLKRVQIGMTLEKALDIMGEPERRYYIEETKQHQYQYTSEFGSSDHYYLFIDKGSNRVVGIGHGL